LKSILPAKFWLSQWKEGTMAVQLDLTPANRLLLAQAFRTVKKVDNSIDCVVEGQMGKAWVDRLPDPQAFLIKTGIFWYFAGDPACPGSRELIRMFPPWNLLMPSAPGWVEAAREQFGDRLQPHTRYSASTDQLSQDHLLRLAEQSPLAGQAVQIDALLANRMLQAPERYFDLDDYEGVSDFLQRGFGYALVVNGDPGGAAYTALVNSKGIEISIYIEEKYRRQGAATLLGARLALEALRRGLRPNWDAANPESLKLARKLGYVFSGDYEAYVYRD
jgi:GNAT superfamily N-acetyltransferase